MRHIQTNGLNVFLETTGDGHPLLFLGGTGWDLRRTRLPLEPPLSDHFTVALFDQRGQGRTSKPPGPYTMLDYAEDAVGVLDALGWKRVHIVGYSFGGMVAQELAIRWPERVGCLVLAATTSGGAAGASYPIHEFLELSSEERALRSLEIADTRFHAFQESRPDVAEAKVKDRQRNQGRFLDEPGARDGLRSQLAARAAHNTFERLKMIEAPTLVVAGSFDGQAPAEAVKRMSSKLPRSKFRVVPGPHDFIAECPEFLEMIVSFLRDE